MTLVLPGLVVIVHMSPGFLIVTTCVLLIAGTAFIAAVTG